MHTYKRGTDHQIVLTAGRTGNAALRPRLPFEDKHLNTVVGVIVRINQRTASIDPGDGMTWRVGFSLLRHVVDI